MPSNFARLDLNIPISVFLPSANKDLQVFILYSFLFFSCRNSSIKCSSAKQHFIHTQRKLGINLYRNWSAPLPLLFWYFACYRRVKGLGALSFTLADLSLFSNWTLPQVGWIILGSMIRSRRAPLQAQKNYIPGLKMCSKNTVHINGWVVINMQVKLSHPSIVPWALACCWHAGQASVCTVFKFVLDFKWLGTLKASLGDENIQ